MNLEALRFLSYYRIRKSRALAVTPPLPTHLEQRHHGRRHEEGSRRLLRHLPHPEVHRRHGE